MQLNDEEYRRIFRKYLSNDASPEESNFTEAYYNAFETEANYTESIEVQEKLRLEETIKQRIEDNIGRQKLPQKKKPIKFWFRYAGAAALFLIVGSGIYTYFNHNLFHTKTSRNEKASLAVSRVHKKTDDQPVLKLANGTVINLGTDNTDKSIKEQAGVTIEKKTGHELVYQGGSQTNAAEDLYNEIHIPKGKQFKIILPDRTTVWLNTASSLRFPIAFSSRERKVFLTGEAFFEVGRDKNKPFRVITKESEIEVTGTSFNISSYEDEDQVKTTLVEGGVVVRYNNQSVQLSPGEQSISNINNHAIRKIDVDTESETAWKSGYFVFDQPLNDIIREMERWYDLDIKIAPNIPQRKLAGRFSRSRDYRQILSYLSELGNFDYSVNGRSILLTRKTGN